MDSARRLGEASLWGQDEWSEGDGDTQAPSCHFNSGHVESPAEREEARVCQCPSQHRQAWSPESKLPCPCLAFSATMTVVTQDSRARIAAVDKTRSLPSELVEGERQQKGNSREDYRRKQGRWGRMANDNFLWDGVI